MIQAVPAPQALPATRHPAFLSSAAHHMGRPIASAPEDFEPAPELDQGLIKGFPWGKRVLHIPEDSQQYMVYAQNGRTVLSCAPTPELAAFLAIQRIEREQVPPDFYSPRLAGTTFGKRADSEGCALVHTVEDASGVVLGESTAGRAAAIELALRTVLSDVNVKDLSREEFGKVNFVCFVDRGRTNALYADHDDGIAQREDIRGVLRQLWTAEPELRQQGGVMGPIKGHPDVSKFLIAAESSLLTLVGKMGSPVAELGLKFDGERRSLTFLYTTLRIPKQQLLDTAYENYVQLAELERARPVERQSA
jgi:hypothetical protein